MRFGSRLEGTRKEVREVKEGKEIGCMRLLREAEEKKRMETARRMSEEACEINMDAIMTMTLEALMARDMDDFPDDFPDEF